MPALSACDCQAWVDVGSSVSVELYGAGCCSCSDFGEFDCIGVGLYSYLCHHNDFTDIFFKCVNKSIKIGIKECLFLDSWWWGNLAYWAYHFFLTIKFEKNSVSTHRILMWK